jgi:hypothetical protein
MILAACFRLISSLFRAYCDAELESSKRARTKSLKNAALYHGNIGK